MEGLIKYVSELPNWMYLLALAGVAVAYLGFDGRLGWLKDLAGKLKLPGRDKEARRELEVFEAWQVILRDSDSEDVRCPKYKADVLSASNRSMNRCRETGNG